MHTHSCKQYTWLSYNKSTFTILCISRAHAKGGRVGVKFQVWHFYWSFNEWRCCGKPGSERIIGNIHWVTVRYCCGNSSSCVVFSLCLPWLTRNTKKPGPWGDGYLKDNNSKHPLLKKIFEQLDYLTVYIPANSVQTLESAVFEALLKR